MSVKQEAGSAGGWREDDSEETDRFGSTTAPRDDLREQRHMRDVEDDSSEEKHFFSHPESARQPLPVVMETASTGNAGIPCTLYACMHNCVRPRYLNDVSTRALFLVYLLPWLTGWLRCFVTIQRLL